MEPRIVLKAVGFWELDPRLLPYYPVKLTFPHPRVLVDESWERNRRGQIVQYLRSGVRWTRYLGYSWCRFENGPPPEKMGTADLSDGVWLWPEGLHVYVSQFHVRLPDDFIAHMERNNFAIPEGLARETFPEHDVDFSFWTKWSEAVSGVHEPPGQ